MNEIFKAAGVSIWKEIRDIALKKGTETLVAEGVRSVFEIVKRRQIRRDEFEFAEWRKAQGKPVSPRPKKSPTKSEGDSPETSDEPTGEASDEPDSDESSESW